MIKSQFKYSIFSKRAQLVAVIAAGIILLFSGLKLFAHVELHVDRTIEMEQMEAHIEREKDREAYDRTQNGDASESDQKRADRFIFEQMS